MAVEFRMLVFRPFVGEIITGEIQSSNEKGIRVSLGFFDDIYIDASMLFDGCLLYVSFVIVILTGSNKQEQAWVWSPDENELFLDNGDKIRFRVEGENFYDHTPIKAPNKDDVSHEIDRPTPYIINVSL